MKIFKSLLIFIFALFFLILSCTTQKTLKNSKNEQNYKQFQNLVAEGDNFFYNYQYKDAIEIYYKAQELFPEYSKDLNFKIASAYFENAEYKNSIQLLNLQDNGNDQDTLFYLGTNYYHLKEFQKALEYYNKCKDTLIIINNKAYMNFCIGNNEEAQKYYQMLANDPNAGLYKKLAHVMLAIIQNDSENIIINSKDIINTINQHISYYEKKKNEIYYDIYIILAICNYQIDDPINACKLLEIAVEKGYRHFDSLKWDPLLSKFITNEEIDRLKAFEY